MITGMMKWYDREHRSDPDPEVPTVEHLGRGSLVRTLRHNPRAKVKGRKGRWR